MKNNLGPSLPEPISGQAIVTYLDSFIAVGGFSDETLEQPVNGSQIYQLKWNCSISSECMANGSEWQKLDQNLMIGRSHAVAMMIPDILTDCESDDFDNTTSFHVISRFYKIRVFD